MVRDADTDGNGEIDYEGTPLLRIGVSYPLIKSFLCRICQNDALKVNEHAIYSLAYSSCNIFVVTVVL